MFDDTLRQLLDAHGVRVLDDVPGVSAPLAVAPDDFKVHDLEAFAERPTRIRETVVLTGLTSFIPYVNRFKNHSSTIFVVPDLSQLSKSSTLATAVIDYHLAKPLQLVDGSGPPEVLAPGARWGSHKVTLKASPSLAYAKLLEIDSKLMAQDEFARWVEGMARFATSHAAADLIELARTLQLTSKGAFKTFDDDFSGSVGFVYDVQVRADAGSAERRLTVPQEIVFQVALIDGLDEVPVPVKFLYRVPAEVGGKVQVGIKIIDRLWLEKAAIDTVAAKLHADTELDVFVGSNA